MIVESVAIFKHDVTGVFPMILRWKFGVTNAAELAITLILIEMMKVQQKIR